MIKIPSHSPYAKATKLKEIPSRIALAPLHHNDPRYIELSDARSSIELDKFQLEIRDASSEDNRYAKIAFTGPRGSGKSTELLRLKEELSDQFVPVYFQISNHVLRECNHIDLFVWLVERLIRRFSEEKWPVNADTVIKISDWFAMKCLDNPDAVKEEIRSEAGTDFQAEYGFYWMPVMLLNRIKSMMIANIAHRENVIKKLHTYTTEMIFYINMLLDVTCKTLKKLDKPPDLLIIIDNLDHMLPATGQKLFFDCADFLKSLRAHFIFTVPYAIRLPPFHITDSFEHCFILSHIQTVTSRNREKKEGVNTLVNIIKGRMDINKLFKDENDARFLAKMSGGNIRDLMTLLHQAQLAARSQKKTIIDMESCKISVERLRQYYEKILIPHQVYYPLLYKINLTQNEEFLLDGNHTSSGVKDSRFFGSELLSTGAAIDNHQDDNSYIIHPVISGIRSFKDFSKRQKIKG